MIDTSNIKEGDFISITQKYRCNKSLTIGIVSYISDKYIGFAKAKTITIYNDNTHHINKYLSNFSVDRESILDIEV